MRNTQKVEYLGKFETKIKIFLGRLSRALMGSIGHTVYHFNTKKSHASVPKGTVKACCNLKGQLTFSQLLVPDVSTKAYIQLYHF
jgi:hypothetical protein